jgi:purine-nucleoside phosphorylase
MEKLGIKTLLVSNASGAINLDFKKSELMLIEDHINLQGGSPLAFKGVAKLGERFVDMSEPYDKTINSEFKKIAKKLNITLHEGIYASVVGPQLETRAEYRMLKTMGADAVGMSTVPEVIVANHLNLKVAAVSVLTDECDPDNLKPVNIEEIIAMANKAEPEMITLFKELIKTL